MENTWKHIVHGGDYNPDQWFKTPEIWDEDMRLMKLSHINSATVGIFAWSLLEPEEGCYNFAWLDTVMDKCAENGIGVILATPSGARPPWMAQKYPEVLRVEANGIRNEYGIRHNHCLTSPVYRQKVSEINTQLAKRYAKHPALKMWHISNEYSGCCHCDLCQAAFREWLKNYYHNDLERLNDSWWNGFWAHRFTAWEQISTPKDRGESHVPALKLCFDRFVTDSHISFLENEIKPLREFTPNIPITTNLMNMYGGINYQKLAKHLDVVSWDSYPEWGYGKDERVAMETAFVHDVNRSFKNGEPFFLMESTPANVNWKDVNKLPDGRLNELAAIQAVAYGADSVQYFQWRKSRGGHEKFHGAVVDHVGNEHTRVFQNVTRVGKALEQLDSVVGKKSLSRVAVICDWENRWATEHYCGYNKNHRDYIAECKKWYAPFYERGICTDVVAMNADLSGFDLVIAPYLYCLLPDTANRLKAYVNNGGILVCTYLTGVVNEDDLCYLGGIPGDGLTELFGLRAEETDSLFENAPGKAHVNGKDYEVNHICDIIVPSTARVLGTYRSDFYAGTPALTENTYGKGTAYYVAFRNDGDFTDDFCNSLIEKYRITPDADVKAQKGLTLRTRGDILFILNFTQEPKKAILPKAYYNLLTHEAVSGEITLEANQYTILKEAE